jgi:hypothetical protein
MYCEYIDRGSAGSILVDGFAESTSPTSCPLDCGRAIAAESISNSSAPVDLNKTFIISSDRLLRPSSFASLRVLASLREAFPSHKDAKSFLVSLYFPLAKPVENNRRHDQHVNQR